MSADEPIIQVNFPLSELRDLVAYLNPERPPIVEQLIQTWEDVQASIEEGING